MRTAGPASLALVVLALALGGPVTAAAIAQSASTSEQHEFPPWRDRHEQIETVLSDGAVVARERIGVGVTNPWRVEIDYRGERITAVWKPLVENERAPHKESWRSEVAAYRLSRYLGIDMVPPTVARDLDGEAGSLQLWVDGCQPYADLPKDELRPGLRWIQQIDRMRLFDAFLDNGDRNAGNFLVDHDWHVVLIDHSRALPLRRRPQPLPPLSTRIDRALLERLRAIEADDLRLLLGDLYSKFELSAILRHRDRTLREVEKAVSKGNAVYFGPGGEPEAVEEPGDP